MRLVAKIETILIMALLFVAPDHGNFLFRKSLITPFPTPIENEYIAEIRKVRKKFLTLIS